MWRGWSGAKLSLSQNCRVRMRRPESDPSIFQKHPSTAWSDIHQSTPLGQSYHSGRENAYFESGVVTSVLVTGGVCHDPQMYWDRVTKNPERERSRVSFMKQRVLKIGFFLSSSGRPQRCKDGIMISSHIMY